MFVEYNVPDDAIRMCGEILINIDKINTSINIMKLLVILFLIT